MAGWLITGGGGFLGRHVLDQVRSRDDVIVIGRRVPPGWPVDRFLKVDLGDPDIVREAVQNTRPQVALHLAGRTPPALPDELYRANVLGTLHLLDALRSLRSTIRLVLAGSAAELGPVDDSDLPVSETYVTKPVNAYGLSKHLASVAALATDLPIEVVLARVFNPIGPGLPDSQAFGRFAVELSKPRTLNRSEKQLPLTLRVGDLEVKRDFVDVRDVAKALIMLAEQGSPGIYHVGTGRSHFVREGLDLLIHDSRRQVHVEIDPRLYGLPGPRDSRADITRIQSEIGWSPSFEFEQSITDLWNEVSLRDLSIP